MELSLPRPIKIRTILPDVYLLGRSVHMWHCTFIRTHLGFQTDFIPIGRAVPCCSHWRMYLLVSIYHLEAPEQTLTHFHTLPQTGLGRGLSGAKRPGGSRPGVWRWCTISEDQTSITLCYTQKGQFYLLTCWWPVMLDVQKETMVVYRLA